MPRLEGPIVIDTSDWVDHLAFSDDSSLLAVAGTGKPNHTKATALVWNLRDGCIASQFEDERINRMAFLPGTTRLATLSRNRMPIWNTESGELERGFLVPGAGEIVDYQGLAVAQDLIAIGSEQRLRDRQSLPNQLHVLRLPGFNPAFMLETEGVDLRFLPGGRLLVIQYGVYELSAMKVFDLATGNTSGGLDESDLDRLIPNPEAHLVWDLAADGHRALIASRDILLFETSGFPWPLTQRIQTFFEHVRGARFGPQGVVAWGATRLGSEGLPVEYALGFWSDTRERWRAAVPGKCYAMACSPDGRVVASISGHVSSEVRDDASCYPLNLREYSSGRDLGTWTSEALKSRLHVHYPEEMAFSPDGAWLAVRYSHHVELWKVSSEAAPPEQPAN